MELIGSIHSNVLRYVEQAQKQLLGEVSIYLRD
jgi:hypothetical protein